MQLFHCYNVKKPCKELTFAETVKLFKLSYAFEQTLFYFRSIKHIFIVFIVRLMHRHFITLTFIFAAYLSFSQEYSQHNNTLFNHYDRYAYAMRDSFHTSMKPYPMEKLRAVANIDSMYYRPVKHKWADIVWNRDLIRHRSAELSLSANPLFNFQTTRALDPSQKAFINTRGAIVSGRLGDKVYFSTSFYENQASFVDYQKQLVDSLGVIPGQGKPKPFKDTAYDYAFSQAYISYSPTGMFNFQLGYGKHFIGDGYRSLLLSDNSFSYPYLKFTTEAWRLKYTALWAQFQEPNVAEPNMPNPKKWGAFHLLDYNVCKWMNIGLFEAVIWENSNENGYRGFDVNYAIPLVFRRPVEYANGSPDNVLLGLNGKIMVTPKTILYGQFVLDEFILEHIRARDGFWANKWGAQAGLKVFDILGVKHLDLQSEYNMVRPFTYTHFTYMQNYGNYGQALAHPLGANFAESVSFLKYQYKRFFVQLKVAASVSGRDTAGTNYGGNIYKIYTTRTLEYDNKIGQGAKRQLVTEGIAVCYLINPQTNMNITLGADLRREIINNKATNTTAVYLAFSTSLSNFYFDY